ncbi:MAG: hypothetical protein ACXVYV_00730, partial [Gaiellales bacterium]
ISKVTPLGGLALGARRRLVASRAMLEAGSHVPDVTVFDQRVTPIRLPALVEQGPALFAFYLYDWTRT